MYNILLLFCMTLSFARSKSHLGFMKTAENPFQYLEEYNYVYENHTVVTEDGYRLLLVRIPYNRNESSSSSTRPPIIFVHGILGTFNDFLVAGPGTAFGFQALENGYDVFLLNTRGSRWSRNHTSLDPDQDAKEFWNFSWHEIGKYDLPATVNYIINATGHSNISYVGYSQGTTAFLVMTSVRPVYNKKIKIATLLAPVAYLNHAKFSMIVLLKRIPTIVEALVKLLRLKELGSYNPMMSKTLRMICGPHSALLPACKLLFYELVGPSTQINGSIISAYFTNYPAGTSAKQLLHFLQNAHSGKFRQYNYGKEGNAAKYGQSEPPDYNLSAITTPVALYYGPNDYLVAKQDENRLASNLPNVVKNMLVPYRKINHFDVIMGENVEELFNEPALNILNRYNHL